MSNWQTIKDFCWAVRTGRWPLMRLLLRNGARGLKGWRCDRCVDFKGPSLHPMCVRCQIEKLSLGILTEKETEEA